MDELRLKGLVYCELGYHMCTIQDYGGGLGIETHGDCPVRLRIHVCRTKAGILEASKSWNTQMHIEKAIHICGRMFALFIISFT